MDWVAASDKLVKQMIRDEMDDLTRSERQLASVLLQDYPMGGLQSITKLAASAAVSTPTVIRMARKLGFDGFPALQDALREEVAAQIKKPISKRDAWMADASAEHPLNRFAEAVASNIRHTLDRLDIDMFDAVARLLADLNYQYLLLYLRRCAAQILLQIVHKNYRRSNVNYLLNKKYTYMVFPYHCNAYHNLQEHLNTFRIAYQQ